MVERRDLKKIKEATYEIPKTFRSDMRVPARLYVSEKLLLDVFRDRSLEQLVNSATLPGIVGYALAMPDIHEGYGLPIGGVVATKLPDGIISPGGVGYDINCLSSGIRVLLREGCYLSIKEIEKIWPKAILKYTNFKNMEIKESPLLRFLKRKEEKYLYQITTKAGWKIKVTPDHPLYTKGGMKRVSNLKSGENLLIYPFEGVHYKNPSSKKIITEGDIKRVLLKLNKDKQANAMVQILNHLKKRALYPLYYNSSCLPYLLKIMGYILGDGTISLIGGKKGIIWFYGNPPDLKEIRKDIQKIGFTPSKVYKRKRQYKIKTFYANYQFERIEYSIKVSSTSFAVLLITLGLPLGNKTTQKYEIPKWIFDLPLWQKRLFLASLFGAELSSPTTLNKYNFYNPTLNINKLESLKRNGEKFLLQISQLLKDFGISTSSIREVKEYRTDGKFGRTIGLRLQILNNFLNLSKFLSQVGFEYNFAKHREGCLALQYLRHKQRIIDLRNKIQLEAKKLYQQGITPSAIFGGLIEEYINKRFLRRSIWERRKTSSRIAFNFPSFEEFKREFAEGNFGLVWDEIEKIEKISYKGWVYDVTIANEDHNFMANNFVVSNCGTRILTSQIHFEEIKPYLPHLLDALFLKIPSGLGTKGEIHLSQGDLDKVLEEGAGWAIKAGYGSKDDLEKCEEKGLLSQAKASVVSQRAKERGKPSVGTLGSGNHFLEVQRVDQVFDQKIASEFGLFEGEITFQIHCGSRGLGHQVCSDYVSIFRQALSKYKIKLPDPELACGPFSSQEGQNYFSAMAAAANFAWTNRHVLGHLVREVVDETLGGKIKNLELKTLYDVAHNIAKLEEYEISGKKIKLCVHRKGATRSFGPGNPALPEVYQKTGQPVLIPGTMGTASYVLVGTRKAEEETFGSTCHGAGRVMSRHAARRQVWGETLEKELLKEGIIAKTKSKPGLAEEAPIAYKDIEEVIRVVDEVGIAKKVARLVPLGVVKG